MQSRKTKKLLSLILVLMMLAAVFAGCGGGDSDDPVDEPPVDVEGDNGDDDVVELNEDEVLLEGALSILNNIPDNNFIMAADEALQIMEDNPNAVFWVDLRSADDYAAGHIDGAVNIPYADMGKNWDVIPQNKQVIFQCYTGQTSAQVAALAQMIGINGVSFRGGMKFGWTPLGLDESTLVTEATDLPAASTPNLDEKGQILWDAAVAYFKPGENFIIGSEELSAIVEDNPDAIMVLDIRGEDDYAAGFVPGAINIPFKTVGKNIDQLSSTKPVYTICYTGQTAGITVAMLRIAGYNAISLSRGMTGWVDEVGLPTVTE